MSKIIIKSYINSKEGKHTFKGKGILKDNKITYYDGKVRTKIILDNIISIEREEKYYIKMNLKESIKLKGIYKTKYGNLNLETIAKKIKKEKNRLEITYDLIIDSQYIDTFKYILEFTIDSI